MAQSYEDYVQRKAQIENATQTTANTSPGPASLSRWSGAGSIAMIILGIVLLLGGGFLALFWIAAGFIAIPSEVGMSASQLSAALMFMLGATFLVLLVPGTLLVIAGVIVRRRK